jgi:hypothetical protein
MSNFAGGLLPAPRALALLTSGGTQGASLETCARTVHMCLLRCKDMFGLRHMILQVIGRQACCGARTSHTRSPFRHP